MKNPLGAFLPDFNINIHVCESGELAGLKFAAKDLFDIKGNVAGAGNSVGRQQPALCTDYAGTSTS